jgi:hypothetical protein
VVQHPIAAESNVGAPIYGPAEAVVTDDDDGVLGMVIPVQSAQAALGALDEAIRGGGGDIDLPHRLTVRAASQV